jgi:hypothetical protein
MALFDMNAKYADVVPTDHVLTYFDGLAHGSRHGTTVPANDAAGGVGSPLVSRCLGPQRLRQARIRRGCPVKSVGKAQERLGTKLR